MFSTKPTCTYGNNQILETVCQYRFPTILQINSTSPAEYQDAIRSIFPRYEARKELPASKASPAPGTSAPAPQPITNHCFSTLDGNWRINLTQNFIALTSRKYSSWEEFARMLDLPLAKFLNIYKPACFDRVGLRYINAFSRKALELEGRPWRELIAEKYLCCMADEAIPEQSFARCTCDLDMAIPGGCRMKLHAGPGMVQKAGAPKDEETKFVLDMDLFMGGDLPLNLAAGSLNTLHTHAWNVFRDAITDTLHDAMEPEEP